jgi:hypothetical protein
MKRLLILSLVLSFMFAFLYDTTALADNNLYISYNGNTIGTYDPATGIVTYDDGAAWLLDPTNKTMTWIGKTNGDSDINQTATFAINAIESGYAAYFETTVPGKILITIGVVDGVLYNNETLVSIAAGEHTVTDSIGLSGGFRWSPCDGYGWRAK